MDSITRDERHVLGAVLINEDCMSELADLEVCDFQHNGHALIFDAMRALTEEGVPINFITLGDEMRYTGSMDVVGDHGYLIRLAQEYMDFEPLTTIVKRMKAHG